MTDVRRERIPLHWCWPLFLTFGIHNIHMSVYVGRGFLEGV